jgi:uncharacterized protein YggE
LGRRVLTLAASVAALGLSVPAAGAQAVDNLISGFAGAADVGGRALGEGLTAGPSLFVTAVGQAPRPRQQAFAFAVSVNGEASTAGEAQRMAAHQIDLALGAARRTGVTALVAEQGFASGDQDANPMAAFLKSQAKDNQTAPPPKPAFTATATLRFRAADPAAEAALLDAMTAAGAKFKLEGKGRSILPGLDLDHPAESIDPAAWDRASQDAIAEAHRQATLLAAAAGVGLGPAQQIDQLGHTTRDDQVSVTVAVRYAITPKP